MSQKISRSQLQKTIKAITAQSELFPEDLAEKAATLNDEDLEKLTITLHVALQSEKALTDEEQEQLAGSVSEYFKGKKRIYESAQKAWLKNQENAHEAQECLFEESLLAQL